MTTTILVSIFSSLIVAIFYGFFISKKEDAIRGYLKNSAKGIVRGVYITAFVSAVRGKDKVGDTSNLAYLLLFFCLSMALYYQQNIKDTVQIYDRQVAEVAGLKDKLLKLNDKKAKKEIESIEKLRESSEKRLNSSSGDAEMLRMFGNVIYIGSFVVFYIGLLLWRPYLVMRKRFGHEMGVFLMRIQGLASKQELANLAVAESKVTNSKSLQEFISLTKEVAARHNVVELVSTFDLWDDN